MLKKDMKCKSCIYFWMGPPDACNEGPFMDFPVCRRNPPPFNPTWANWACGHGQWFEWNNIYQQMEPIFWGEWEWDGKEPRE